MKIVSITQIEKSYVRYDLEVEDNHNFVADGIVVHNSFAQFVFHNGDFHIKSSKQWKREYPNTEQFTIEFFTKAGKTEDEAKELVDSIQSRPKTQCGWWKALRDNKELQDALINNPGTFFFAELFGNTNRIKYKIPEGNRLAFFDIWKDGEYFSPKATKHACDLYKLEHVPIIVDEMEWDYNKIDEILNMAEGKTAIPNAASGTIREGIVVKPLIPAWHPKIGRTALKFHSPSFLSL